MSLYTICCAEGLPQPIAPLPHRWHTLMFGCMRTTIRLDERLLRDLKQHAASHGRTLTAVIADAARQFLARAARADGRPRLPPFRVATLHGRLGPGVDLDDGAALLDVMEGDPAPRRR